MVVKIDTRPAYHYHEVYIKPQWSEVVSRKDVSTSQTLFGQKVDVPIISANMDTVTDGTFAEVVVSYGGMAAIHRFQTIEENVVDWKRFQQKRPKKQCFCSLGVNISTEMERFKALYDAGARWFIIDVANGASANVLKMVKSLKDYVDTVHNGQRDFHLVIGNFANPSSMEPYLETSIGKMVDGFKIGIGPGFVCTTKNVTGVTVPQFSAVVDCSHKVKLMNEHDGRKRVVIADGGIREIGDIAKAIGAGADFVMSGKLFAECAESIAGRSQDQHAVSLYRGMASSGAMKTLARENLATPEGKEVAIEINKSTKTLLEDIKGGLQSSMSYCNRKNLEAFKGNISFGVRYSE